MTKPVDTTATLEDDGSTLYRTESYQEFVEAIAAARAEGADVKIQSTGRGFAAKLFYPDEDSSETAEPEAPSETPDETADGDESSTEAPEVEAEAEAPQSEAEDLLGDVAPAPSTRSRKKG